MRSLLLAVAAGAVALSGCRHGTVCWPYPSADETIIAGPPHPAPEGMTWQLVPNGSTAVSSPPVTLSDAPARFGAPTTEACPAPCPPAAPKTVFVRGPQQRIIIERECPPAERKERAAPPPPERERAEAVAAAQDVLLIPRTVYVPYVAQAPTRAARLVQPVAPEEVERAAPPPPPEKDRGAPPPPPKVTVQPCPTEVCPDECGPTTIIEIRQMNQRIDRLHRMLERLVPGHRQ